MEKCGRGPGKGVFPETNSRFCDYIRAVLAALDRALAGEALRAPGADAGAFVFSFGPGPAGDTDYWQPVYRPRRGKDGVREELLFLLGCRCGSHAERRYLACRVLDEYAAELRRMVFESDAGRLEALAPPEDRREAFAREEAGRILDRTWDRLSEEMRGSLGFSFRELDILSLMDYEQEQAEGCLLFLSSIPDGGMLEWSLEGRDVFFTQEHLRMVRKLLAGVTPEGAGQAASALVFVKAPGEDAPGAAFSGAAPLEEGRPEPALCGCGAQVVIHGPLKWELSLCGCPLFRRGSGGLLFPAALSREDAERKRASRIQEALAEVFGPGADTARLAAIVQAVEKQRHGAAVLVADWRSGVCRQNLDALARDSKALRTTWGPLPEKRRGVITNAAKMDGAVLVDAASCEIVALATILQAETCTPGKASRGSRYNSINNAACALKSAGGRVAAFVFSSDGGMDILPEGRPDACLAGQNTI